MVLTPCSTRGAQTVLCRVHGEAPTIWKNMGHERTPIYVTARIFDPLHYDAHDRVYEADHEYAQEAASYYQIHAHQDIQAFKEKPEMVPKFYGTWSTIVWRKSKPTMSITKSKLQSMVRSVTHRHLNGRVKFQADRNPKSLVIHGYRPIRIVLTEHVSSWTMDELCLKMPNHDPSSEIHVQPYKEKFKSHEDFLDLFAQVLDNFSRVLSLGIDIPQPELKYIMVTNDQKAVVADFSQAWVAKYTDIGWFVHELLPGPNNPSYIFRIKDFAIFSGWFPLEWLSTKNKGNFENWAKIKLPAEYYTSLEDLTEVMSNSGWCEMLHYYNGLPPPKKAAFPPTSTALFKEKHGKECFDIRLLRPDGTPKSHGEISKDYPYIY